MGNQVLVVDDSGSMRQMVSFTLSEEGYDVIEAENGRDGLDKMDTADNLKLIVSDIHMPEMNGIEFVKAVRKNAKYKFVPIIILTTESEKGMQEQGRSAGASAWIVKPFTAEQLKETAKRVAG